ncbi:GH20162 [Drosophila grimshawi]|uniref:GH20162 n=1 Tax=Drosophila grimshawi TaxID=7222 RepID=B4J6F4_DROGR|nr:GH20162 [Drosophila grimshawi]
MSSSASMDNTCDQDYTEFLNEYLLQTNLPGNEPETHYEDGEMEAEWLISAGYPELTKPFERGIELRSTVLEPVLATLSRPHAEAIKQRVRALNHTVRGRTKNRSKRKPDIRDVFRDFDESSTGTRSRSATPDSLDSVHGDDVWGNPSIPSFVSISTDHSATNYNNAGGYPTLSKHLKQKIRRTPSAPLKSATSTDIFRGSQVRCDIPMYSSEGIELLGFSKIGTLHMPPRNRSGSDPSCSIGRVCGQNMQDSQSENNTSSGDSSDEYLPNTASGVTVSDVCKTTYEEIKKDKKHRYVIFYIRDEKQIDVETVGDRNSEYDQFLEDIQKCGPGECRYGLFDFEYMHQCQGTSESSKKQKLFLMSWCPDTAKVKKKMLYSSSFDALKKSLVGVQKYIQATDLSEASREAVEEKLRATDRQ